MSFGKAFFSSCLGALTALVVFTILSIIIFGAIVGGMTSETEVVVAENSVLHLELDGEISELQKENPLAGLPVPGGDQINIGVLQLKQAIAHAKTDANIQGIYLDVSYPQAGFSSLEEIRESLIDFRTSGKWVISYGEVMSEPAYYLATAAHKIYLNPEGDIEFNGLTVDIGFFKRMLNKLEIKPQVFRVGEYKSAVEPFLLEQMSPENRLQLTELINSIYDHVLNRISQERAVPVEKLRDIADNMLVRDASAALEMNLVDSLLYKDQFDAVLKQKLGVDETRDMKFISYGKYRKSFSGYKKSKNEIAVIVAEGTIMPGEGESDDVIGGEEFVEEIRKAREDDDVKAIVLRVNSPGGEFRASDMIWREVQLAKKAKPIIASMGDYATSGGYYLSMGCDTIVAQPHTITGSIGIFGVMFDMSDFLGNKLGITFDEVRTGKFGEMYTVTRPLSDTEKQFWQRSLDKHYETFATKAAEGRDMPLEELKKVASGRVWTGVQAKEHKLVDMLGGFDDAVRIAAVKAGIEKDYKLKFFPQERPFFEELVSRLEENAKVQLVKEELGDLYPWYTQFEKIKTFQGEQARMPFELTIH
ncbi:MAG TPA: signal peptide peptidase SppA [Chryseosolibacter sp.]|nr:signal peptide peptidase SppA [Chryseosolibacter sp.]